MADLQASPQALQKLNHFWIRFCFRSAAYSPVALSLCWLLVLVTAPVRIGVFQIQGLYLVSAVLALGLSWHFYQKYYPLLAQEAQGELIDAVQRTILSLGLMSLAVMGMPNMPSAFLACTLSYIFVPKLQAKARKTRGAQPEAASEAASETTVLAAGDSLLEEALEQAFTTPPERKVAATSENQTLRQEMAGLGNQSIGRLPGLFRRFVMSDFWTRNQEGIPGFGPSPKWLLSLEKASLFALTFYFVLSAVSLVDWLVVIDQPRYQVQVLHKASTGGRTKYGYSYNYFVTLKGRMGGPEETVTCETSVDNFNNAYPPEAHQVQLARGLFLTARLKLLEPLQYHRYSE